MSEWLAKSLGELAEIRVSNVDKKSVDGELPVRLCNYMDVYSSNEVDDSLPFMRATASRAEVKRFGLQDGDVVITKDSESPDDIAVPAYVSDVGDDVVCGYHLAILRPTGLADGKYLSYLLRTEAANRHFARTATGSTRYGLSIRSIKSAPLVIRSSKDEQRRIAELLSAVDEQLGSIEAQIAKWKLQFVGLQRTLLSCSSLKEADADDVLLRELIPAVQYGISTSLEPTGVVPVLRMNNLGGGEIDVTDLKYSPRRVRPELLLKDGDVLFNRTNSMEHVGRTSIWRSQLAEATFASYLVRLLPDENRITKQYLVYLLGWEEHQTQMRRYATPGVQQVNINPTNLRLCKVRVPRKLSAQRRVVEALDACREYISALTADVEKLRLKKRGLALDLLTSDGRASS